MALAFLTLPRPVAAQHVTLHATAGIDGKVRPSRWTPVHVAIAVDDSVVDGELLVQWGDTRLHRAVDLPAGAPIDVLLYLRASEPAGVVDVRLLGRGGEVSRVASPVTVVPYDTEFRVCVGDGDDRADTAGCTARIDASALPVSMRGYDAVDDVVWQGGVDQRLTVEQRTAYARWRANRRRLSMDVFAPPPQLVWKDTPGPSVADASLVAGTTIVALVLLACTTWARRRDSLVAGPLAIGLATVVGAGVAVVAGRAGPTSEVVVEHATTVQQIGDGSVVSLRGRVVYPARGSYTLALASGDGGMWSRSASGVETWFDRDGMPVLTTSAGRDERRDIELEAVADYAPFDVSRKGDRISVRNASDSSMTQCLFGEARPGKGRALAPGASLDADQRDVTDAPFFSCHIERPPIVVTDPAHGVRLEGDALVAVWLPVDRPTETTP